MTKEPFTSKEVRQALNYAVNNQELSDGLYNGNMVPAGGVLPPVDWAFNPDLQAYSYDPDRARELLAAAGYDESNPLTFTFMAYTIPRGYNPVGDRLATAIQEYWSEVGVQAEIQTAEWTQYRADRRAGLFACDLYGWQGDNGDPDNFLATFFYSATKVEATRPSTTTPRSTTSLSKRCASRTWRSERRSTSRPSRSSSTMLRGSSSATRCIRW